MLTQYQIQNTLETPVPSEGKENNHNTHGVKVKCHIDQCSIKRYFFYEKKKKRLIS